MSAARELVDVLDDAGRVVGVATRAEMRSRRLPHRCVYILVFDSQGRLFVHERTSTKDVFPSFWDVAVGGVVAAGESFDLAAEREGHEELGVPVKPEFLFPFYYKDERNTAFAQVYRARHDGPFALQEEEIVQGLFVSIEEAWARAAQAPFCPDGLQVLKTYCDALRSET